MIFMFLTNSAQIAFDFLQISSLLFNQYRTNPSLIYGQTSIQSQQ